MNIDRGGIAESAEQIYPPHIIGKGMAQGSHERKLNGFFERKVALVLVDIQNKFAKSSDALEQSTRSRIGYVNEVSEEFRRTGNPVIQVLFDGESYHGEGIENPDDLVDGLAVADTDLVVHKTDMNSFKDSDLEKVVREQGCSGIVIAGMVAHYCVIATYYAAFDHGIVSYILKGGIMSNDEETIACVERITKAVDLDDIRRNVNFSGGAS
mgnify:CR=1 FL=1